MLQQAEELWVRAIENAAILDYSEDSNSDVRSISVTRSTDTLSKLLAFPQSKPGSVNSVTLTFFDRKAFFSSLAQLTGAILMLLLAVILGNWLIYHHRWQGKDNKFEDVESGHKMIEFNRFAEEIQKEYAYFVDKKLKLSEKSYAGLLEEATEDFGQLDHQLSELVKRVYRIQRELDGGEVREK